MSERRAYSAVVIAGITARVSKIAPVGATEYHIQTEDGDARGVVVLVEYPLELVIEQCCALLETDAAWWVETTALRCTVLA